MSLIRPVLAAIPLALAAMIPSSGPVTAQTVAGQGAVTATGFDGYVQLLAAKARAEGVSEPTILRMTSGLSYNPRVVALDRNQPGSNSSPSSSTIALAPYIRTHVDAARIRGGRNQYATLGPLGGRLEQEFGVPPKIALAIWGHETNYGSYRGDFDLARSLATLAYDGRRRQLFADEFIALLKMADRGIPRERLVGSWAGAFGNPQFLPSVYLRIARDGDGDGQADIWYNRADTLASIAHYFEDAGWRRGEPWGVRAAVPAGFDASPVATKLGAPSCPRVHARHSTWKTVAEWRALGITPLASIGDNTLATLIEPDGRGQPAYLLTGNYRVILQYNCSNYYALSVGLLADEIAR